MPGNGTPAGTEKLGYHKICNCANFCFMDMELLDGRKWHYLTLRIKGASVLKFGSGAGVRVREQTHLSPTMVGAEVNFLKIFYHQMPGNGTLILKNAFGVH